MTYFVNLIYFLETAAKTAFLSDYTFFQATTEIFQNLLMHYSFLSNKKHYCREIFNFWFT